MKSPSLTPPRLAALAAWTRLAVALCVGGSFAVPLYSAEGIKNLTLTGTTTDQSAHNNSGAHVFLSGASATFNAGSTLTINGVFAGTPTSGTLNLSALTLTLGAQSGASLTALNATQLTSGTVPDARFPATLPAASGVNLTALNATNLASGTVAAARMPALTGDITTSAGAVATTLATVNSNVGTFGSATASPAITINAKGLVTAVSNVTITPPVGSITGLGTGVATLLAGTSSGTGGPAGTISPTFTGTINGAAATLSGAMIGPSHTGVTDLTLGGGSAGASLVLGQGTDGGSLLTAKGTGLNILTGGAGVRVKQAAASQTVTADLAVLAAVGADGVIAISQQARGTWSLKNLAAGSVPSTFSLTGDVAGPMTFGNSVGEAFRMSPTLNLLIGGATDITGSGGLKVFGTTAATSTTTGSLINAGGFGNAGAIYAGGTINATNYLGITGTTVGSAGVVWFGTDGATGSFWNVPSGNAARVGVNNISVINTTSAGVAIIPTTASTSTTTGSLINAGGFGNAGKAYFGDLVNIRTSTAAAGIDLGATQANQASIYLRATDVGSVDWRIYRNASNSIINEFNSSPMWTVTSAGNGTLAGTINVSGTGASAVGGNLTIGAGTADTRVRAVPNSAYALSVSQSTGNGNFYIGASAAAQPDLILSNNSGAERATLTDTGNLSIDGSLTVGGTQNVFGVPASANALGTNSTMTFELTSNTSLTVKVRGTDGTTRSVVLTLAP